MILFVRHGETAPNRDGLVLGRADPVLTEEGRRQARCLARVLAEERAVALHTSPLRRARETAEALAAPCGLEPVVDDRLIEVDWGEWEGRSSAGIGSGRVLTVTVRVADRNPSTPSGSDIASRTS